MSMDVYQEVTDAIVAQLRNGVVPWRKPWVAIDGGLPRNLRSGKPYRGVNLLLLSMMPYTSPFWCTFKQAREAGGCVRTGERSTVVVFWKRLKVKDETSKTGYKMIPMLRHYRVFNVEQCDGVSVPDLPEVPEFNPVDEAERIAAMFAAPKGPVVKYGGDTACYIPAWDELHMPLRESFRSPAAFYSTLYHEMTHSTGHKSRLDRKGGASFGDADYAREELVAELGASMLSAHAGLFQETLPASASYINNWLGALERDVKLVVWAAGKAQRAADYIMGVEFSSEDAGTERVAVAA